MTKKHLIISLILIILLVAVIILILQINKKPTNTEKPVIITVSNWWGSAEPEKTSSYLTSIYENGRIIATYKENGAVLEEKECERISQEKLEEIVKELLSNQYTFQEINPISPGECDNFTMPGSSHSVSISIKTEQEDYKIVNAGGFCDLYTQITNWCSLEE